MRKEKTAQEHPNYHTYLERAIDDGQAVLEGEGRNERLRYVEARHSERWADPLADGLRTAFEVAGQFGRRSP